MGLPRLLFRAWKDQRTTRKDDGAERVLILGAGQAGEALVRDLRRTGRYEPVGFLDDAVALRGTRLQGYRFALIFRQMNHPQPRIFTC